MRGEGAGGGAQAPGRVGPEHTARQKGGERAGSGADGTDGQGGIGIGIGRKRGREQAGLSAGDGPVRLRPLSIRTGDEDAGGGEGAGDAPTPNQRTREEAVRQLHQAQQERQGLMEASERLMARMQQHERTIQHALDTLQQHERRRRPQYQHQPRYQHQHHTHAPPVHRGLQDLTNAAAITEG